MDVGRCRGVVEWVVKGADAIGTEDSKATFEAAADRQELHVSRNEAALFRVPVPSSLLLQFTASIFTSAPAESLTDMAQGIVKQEEGMSSQSSSSAASAHFLRFRYPPSRSMRPRR